MLTVYEHEMSRGHACCRVVGGGLHFEQALQVLRNRQNVLLGQGYYDVLPAATIQEQGMALMVHRDLGRPTILLKIDAL